MNFEIQVLTLFKYAFPCKFTKHKHFRFNPVLKEFHVQSDIHK